MYKHFIKRVRGTRYSTWMLNHFNHKFNLGHNSKITDLSRSFLRNLHPLVVPWVRLPPLKQSHSVSRQHVWAPWQGGNQWTSEQGGALYPGRLFQSLPTSDLWPMMDLYLDKGNHSERIIWLTMVEDKETSGGRWEEDKITVGKYQILLPSVYSSTMLCLMKATSPASSARHLQ